MVGRPRAGPLGCAALAQWGAALASLGFLSLRFCMLHLLCGFVGSSIVVDRVLVCLSSVLRPVLVCLYRAAGFEDIGRSSTLPGVG